MRVLGIESSCDDCSIAIVEDGRRILSSIVATQIEIHRPYMGVVPEIASRTHTEWIRDTFDSALAGAGMGIDAVDGIAVTSRPGLVGSLLVGLSFAKGVSLARSIPFVTVNHVQAHLYAPQLERDIPYPFLGLLVSGGHTMICRVERVDDIQVLGTTIDVPTVDGKVSLKVPATTRGGRQLRLRGKGLPTKTGTRGDLYAVVSIQIPIKSTAEENKLWEQLAEKSKFNPRKSL